MKKKENEGWKTRETTYEKIKDFFRIEIGKANCSKWDNVVEQPLQNWNNWEEHCKETG